MSTTLASLLTTTPPLYARLGDALVPGSTGDGGDRVSGATQVSQPAPARLDVAEHRHELVRGLTWWVARLDGTLRMTPHTYRPRPVLTSRGGVTGLCAWLAYVTPSVPRHHTELAENLQAWQTKAQRFLTSDGPARHVPLPAGCMNTTELWTCPGELSLAIPPKGKAAPYLTCRECRGRWEVTELPQAADVRLPVQLAADLTGVHHYQLRRWAGGANTITLGNALRNSCAL